MRSALLGGAVLLVVMTSGCGGSSEDGSDQPPTDDAPASTTVAGAGTTAAGTSATLATSTATPRVQSTAPAGGYTSAIVNEVVANPAFDALEAEVIKRLRAVGLPGASLLVVQHGRLVEQEAWLGYNLDTVVPTASAAKWLTAATIMTLVDEGKLKLDEPLSTYVPAITGQVGRITTRQLLSFTSGLTDDKRVPCTENPATTLQECARAMLALGVVHPPGEAFRYGSQHMLVAGALAEIVSGKPFVELFRERIAEPLGMTRTGFFQAGSGGQRDNVTHPNPAGSGYSSLGDYGKFLEMIYHDGVAPTGKRILSAASIAEMQKNQIEGARYGSASEFRVAFEAPYGLGEWIDWTDASGKALVVSSDGKFGFRPWLDKKNDLFGVYLIHDTGEGYVQGDPDAGSADTKKVITSGLWVFVDTAAALGGSLPKEYYPDR